MPKQTIEKEAILTAALDLTRENGFGVVNARSVAQKMGCSVQPIYSYCSNMEGLKEELYCKAMEFYSRFIAQRTDPSEYLPSMGAANIAFAKDEPHLFRLLFLSRSRDLSSFSDIYEWMGDPAVCASLSDTFGFNRDQAQSLYVMMIVFTHGIATMLATDSAQLSDDEIVRLMQRAYAAFLDYHKKQTEHNT